MDENTIEYKVGQRIRAARLARKMSQADLAFEAHVSLPHISDIELGKKEMLLTTFCRIIEALQVSADEILRPDVPEVNRIYQKEFAELLNGGEQNISYKEFISPVFILNAIERSMKSGKEEMINEINI